MSSWEEKKEKLVNKNKELYDLIDKKLRSKFNVNDYSSEYVQSENSLTLIINNTEYYVEFGEYTTIIIYENLLKKRASVYAELDLVDDKWMMTHNSIFNTNESGYALFNESVLDRTIRQFEFYSRSNK